MAAAAATVAVLKASPRLAAHAFFTLRNGALKLRYSSETLFVHILRKEVEFFSLDVFMFINESIFK